MAKYFKKTAVINVIENHANAVCGMAEDQIKDSDFTGMMVDVYKLAHKHLVEVFTNYTADGMIEIPTSTWFHTEKEGVFRCIACSSEFKIPCIDGEPIWKGCPICLARMVKVSQ